MRNGGGRRGLQGMRNGGGCRHAAWVRKRLVFTGNQGNGRLSLACMGPAIQATAVSADPVFPP